MLLLAILLQSRDATHELIHLKGRGGGGFGSGVGLLGSWPLVLHVARRGRWRRRSIGSLSMLWLMGSCQRITIRWFTKETSTAPAAESPETGDQRKGGRQ
jgi:hypothetical protein